VTDNIGTPEYLEYNVQNLAASGGTSLVIGDLARFIV
jgi:hypothetical protein